MQNLHNFRANFFLSRVLGKIAQNRILQKRKSAILCEIKLANDCTKCYFFVPKCSEMKAKLCKSFANGNRMYFAPLHICVNGNVYGLCLLYNVKYTQLCFSFDCLLFTPCLENVHLLIIGGFFHLFTL